MIGTKKFEAMLDQLKRDDQKECPSVPRPEFIHDDDHWFADAEPESEKS